MKNPPSLAIASNAKIAKESKLDFGQLLNSDFLANAQPIMSWQNYQHCGDHQNPSSMTNLDFFGNFGIFGNS